MDGWPKPELPDETGTVSESGAACPTGAAAEEEEVGAEECTNTDGP